MCFLNALMTMCFMLMNLPFHLHQGSNVKKFQNIRRWYNNVDTDHGEDIWTFCAKNITKTENKEESK